MNLEELSPESLRALRSQVGDVARERIDELFGERKPAAVPPREPAPARFQATLPWSALASDNKNVGIAGDRSKREAFAIAKLRATELLREAYGERDPSDGPVRVTAALYVPDRRVLDPPNFTKGLLDALKGIVITDDRWTVLRWFEIGVAGVDVDRPRCELLMEPWHDNVTVAPGTRS